MQTVLGLSAFALALYVAIAGLLAAGQKRLLYYPLEVDETLAAEHQHSAFSLEVPGAELHGWFPRGASATKPILIYYGGNGDELSRYLPVFSRLPCCTAALVNYRGYGGSTGEPDERLLYADALAVFDEIRRVAPEVPILVMGRSLGSGIAMYVAAHRPVEGLVLISPYDSIASIAADHFPFFPTRWLLRERFEAARYAPEVGAPVLVFLAEQDRVISRARSEALLEAFGRELDVGSARPIVLPGTDHNSIMLHPELWRRLAAWVDLVLGAPPSAVSSAPAPRQGQSGPDSARSGDRFLSRSRAR